MHLDVVLEILGHLHPLMLLQVSRASKTFRQLLRSPITDSTWRNSFSADPQLLRCSPQISGRRWAKLLFGPHICDECGRPGTEPDYTICQRICTACMDMKYVHEFNSMVHRTVCADQATLDAERSETHNSHYVPQAVHRFVKSLIAVESENQKVCGFFPAAFVLLILFSQRAELCKSWARRVLSDSRREYYRMLNRVTASIKKRLISEGFDEEDIYQVRYDIGECDALWRKPRLTSKLWHRARPDIVALIINAQTERLESERKWRIRHRQRSIVATVQLTLRTPVTGSPRCFHRSLSSATTPESSPRLLTVPSSWTHGAWKCRRLLVSFLPAADAARPDLRLLARATSVFRVQKPSDLAMPTPFWTAIGWDEARAYLHWCSGYTATDMCSQEIVQFDGGGAATVAAIAGLVGLDPATTTAVELDALDTRFMCTTCTGIRRQALPWHDCVLHDVERIGHSTAPHSVPSWALLSHLATADARRREEAEDYSSVRNWACMLCHNHAPGVGTETHNYMKYHIRTMHDIQQPVEGEHLISFASAERPARRHASLAVGGEHPARYRCNRCAQDLPEVVKLFSLRGIQPHILFKHFVESPGEEDWTEDHLIVPVASGSR
ncbi:hypothetical protein B0H14DRAFT_3428351 [Mycena olivaceomarginata]|nr:hypothetical protein B0H14DRAFT_3428351 [Mycena olivaceomarginata]